MAAEPVQIDRREDSERFNGKLKELDGFWFTCPACQNEDVAEGSPFCNLCGREIVWIGEHTDP